MKSKTELQSMAIRKTAESNIIKSKKDKKGPGLELDTQKKMGQMGMMNAMEQVRLIKFVQNVVKEVL